MSNYSFVVIFHASIDTLTDKIATVDALFPHTSFPLPLPIHSLPLKLSCLTLLLCLPPGFSTTYRSAVAGANAQEFREICSTASAMLCGVYLISRALVCRRGWTCDLRRRVPPEMDRSMLRIRKPLFLCCGVAHGCAWMMSRCCLE